MFKYILTFLWEFIMDKKNDQTSKTGVGKKIIIFALIAGSFTINYVAINRLYAVSKAHIELSKKFKEVVANKKDLDQCKVKIDNDKYQGYDCHQTSIGNEVGERISQGCTDDNEIGRAHV